MIHISACVIVKNEAGNIGHWLENMRSIADECIVVDTGSEDTTIQLAKAGGAQVFSYEWQEDFAAAKNYALEQARGEWILFLDADEYFSPRALPKVRSCIAKYHSNRKIVGLACRLVNIDADDNNRFINEVCQARVFRNIRTLRYEGKVHEGLCDSIAGRRMQLVPELEIYHTGYSSGVFREKCVRNLKLLQNQIALEGEKPEHWFYLMKCWVGLEDYEKAAAYAQRAVRAQVAFPGAETTAYEVWLNASIKLERPIGELLQIAEEAISVFPKRAEFYLLRGCLQWDAQAYFAAGQDLQQGIRLYEAPDSDFSLGKPDNATGLLPKAYYLQGCLAAMKGDEAGSAEAFLCSLQRQPYQPEALRRLYAAMKEQKPADIIDLLNHLYNKEQDAAFLSEVLQAFRPSAVWLYYAQLAGERQEIVRTYLAAGQYGAAVVERTRTLDALYRLGIAAALSDGKEPGGALSALLPKAYLDVWKMPDSPDNGLAASVHRLQGESPHRISKDNPMVSIMIPTYNRPGLFELTLQSALAQTYPDIEIIICDNSTDDRTELLVKKYQGDTRIRYVRNRQARTKAENFQPFEQLARGEYLQWLMDDDILSADKLTKMVPILRDDPQVKLVTSNRGVIDGAGKLMGNFSQEIVETKREFALLDGRAVGRRMLMSAQNFLGEPSAVLFRREDLEHHYWQADCRGYKTISDVVMWLELLEKGYCVYFTHSLSYYRRHGAQEGQQADVVLLSRIEWYRLAAEYYERHIFLEKVDEFNVLLNALQRDSVNLRENPLWQQASPDMRQRYEQCMEKIGRALEIVR